MKIDEIDFEAFTCELIKQIDKFKPSCLLGIDGIYEILADEFNNDVIRALTSQNESEEG